MDRKGVLSNLKGFAQWDSNNYPLRKEEADVIIEALEEGDMEAKIKPVPVSKIVTITEGLATESVKIPVSLGECSNCCFGVSNRFTFCPNCGRKLDWSTNNG